MNVQSAIVLGVALVVLVILLVFFCWNNHFASEEQSYDTTRRLNRRQTPPTPLSLEVQQNHLDVTPISLPPPYETLSCNLPPSYSSCTCGQVVDCSQNQRCGNVPPVIVVRDPTVNTTLANETSRSNQNHQNVDHVIRSQSLPAYMTDFVNEKST